MDASGKIEVYQDPVLYRCSMMIRLIINYHSNTAKRASITRLDLHCEKMEFSMTEQQIPMLLRLVALILALQSKQLPVSKERSLTSVEERENASQDELDEDVGMSSEGGTWGGWAWDVVSSFLPVDWDNDWSSEQQMAYSGHTIHLGIYVDNATVTFKTIDSVKEQLFYKSRKIRYKSFLSLRLTGVVIDALLQGITMTTFQVGLGSIQLYPRGMCSCGFAEIIDGAQPPLYLVAGKLETNHLKDSLFDDDAVENKGKKREYKQGIDYHLATVSVESLLERCPALVMDYVHHIELPDDITPERLSELGSNFEYSNFHERRVMRYVIGDLIIRLCSGLFHRIETMKEAAMKYDYSPYIIPKPEPTIDELPPVTVEEYDALRENISMVEMKVILVKCALQLQASNHRITSQIRPRKFIDNRTAPLSPALTEDPVLTVEWDKMNVNIEQPMYPFRLIACASKQTDISPDMFNYCHRTIDAEVQGLRCQLRLTNKCRTSIVMPCKAEYSQKSILYPQYWRSLDLIHVSHSIQIDAVTITGTKAKLICASSMVTSILNPLDMTNPLECSSLLSDACRENNPIYLEVSIENINFKCMASLAIISNIVNITSVKIFALNDSQQAIIMSGPESDDDSEEDSKALLMAIVQFSRDPAKQIHPPVISFQAAQIRGSLDPLLCQWLQYQVPYYKVGTTQAPRLENQQSLVEGTSSDTGTRKKNFPSLHESVHSSSDQERRKSVLMTDDSKTASKLEESQKCIEKSDDITTQEKTGILITMIKLYPWWRGLVLSGHIGHIILYIPTETMSGIGVHGIEQAKDRALQEIPNLQILVIKLPVILVHSVNVQPEMLMPYLKVLPVKLPKAIWTTQTQSFPWTLTINDFHCYTLQKETSMNFIKKVSLNATIGLTTKAQTNDTLPATNATSENNVTALALCVHVDTSPIIISVSEEQVSFMSNIALTVLNIMQVSQHSHISFVEDTTTASTISTSKEESEQEQNNLTLTAWIQWTITKVSVKLYVMGQLTNSSLKSVLELEDIITSLDLQPVYFKLKNKITTATVFHYTRAPQAQNWDLGDYGGLVMCGREDTLEKGEDSGFFSLTLTRAKSGNVHTRWGAHRQNKAQDYDFKSDSIRHTNRYISEIVIKMQMMDIILPLSILAKYMQLVKPFTRLINPATKVAMDVQEKTVSSPIVGVTSLSNDSLPLIYLEFKGFRLMLPGSTTARYGLLHDLLMIQLDGIVITPHAENPICRTPLRSDIYQLAAQANILNVPGSAVEDRQYQINIKGVCAYTTMWKNYQVSVTKRMSQSYLYTMNENPALEWNKLGNGSSLEPHFSTFPMITRFDLCLIVAPATIYKPDTIVCGNAVEVNCLTDIEVTINLDQIKLGSILFSELKDTLIGYSEDYEVVDIPSSPGKSFQRIHNEFTANITNISRMKPLFDDADADFTKDSGVDFEMSSVNSTIVGCKSLPHEHSALPPYEFLFNCGKVTFVLYEAQQALPNTEYLMDINEVDEDDNTNIKQPLLYVMINQPNVYVSQQRSMKKVQVSCFDIAISLGDDDAQELTSIPNPTDFKIHLIETKNGDPHPDTGIPPSFLIVKCQQSHGKSPEFFINMERPTKVHCSLSRLNQIDSIRNKVLACFSDVNVVVTPSKVASEDDILPQKTSIKSKKYNVPNINLTTKQIVLSLVTDSGSETMISFSALSGNISNAIRPERIYGNLALDSFIISVILDGKIKVLLNPWCCNITVYLVWEAWQDPDSVPQIQIQADSDSIYFDFGPEQIKIVKTVIDDCQMILRQFIPQAVENKITEIQSGRMSEQHYKDDLKAGAFQFIDGNADELPFPYQVVFFTHPQQAMAWRYPQPRTLTRLHVSPVPFKTSSNEDVANTKVPCTVEYWSESHTCYQRYVDFYLSETDSYRLDLPDNSPGRAVACVWRVVLAPQGNSSLVSARALAACLRIDSYFNPTIIPNLQAALNISAIHIAFYNHIDAFLYNDLPKPLHNYTLNSMIPETQCFMSLEHKEAIIVLHRWSNGGLMLDVGGTLSIRVLDYGLLNMHETLDPLEGKVELSMSEKMNVSVTCNPFSLRISPAIIHTLSVSAYLWARALNEDDKNVVIMTRYVIANDTNIPIRFGQTSTDDNILLQSRQCHFYSWRHVNNQTIRVAVEDNAWAWSHPFSVKKDGLQMIEFSNAIKDITICVDVTSLSATQKLITFSGQLIISNQLIDRFEMKLVKHETETGSKPVPSKGVFNISGKSQPPSIVLENNANMAIRLRFSSLSNLSWTGDIPLLPNTKWSQPWLVKVPLQERGQFLSIWVRIVNQVIHGKTKILAVLSPLYMIRSHLPVPAKVQMETPSLKVSLSTTVNGRGERQQLYCPGTSEHFHQLTFQLESGISASNPYVPLSYSSVDQRKFFKRPENEDIEAILKALDSQTEDQQWPFQGDDVYEWMPAEQPQTHVQVKYQDAGLVSSTLLLELQPWCFILNSLGCHISLVSEDIELCQIPHYGIVTPPKLESTFHLGVGIGDTYYTSQALQLARPDWSQSFYMPRIGGLIPVEGNIKTTVDCASSLCMLSINSIMHEDMRLIRVTSTHVIGNITSQELCVATLAVHETSVNLRLPADLTPYSVNVLPSEDQRQATPIVQWHTLYGEHNAEPVALYISLSLGHQWSCPIRVDQGMSRRCLAIPNGYTTMAVVVTTQEDKGTMYIMVHTDNNPQLLIYNGCPFKILLGQANPNADEIISETPHFSWICEVENGGTCHYSLPAVGSRLPDTSAPINTTILLTAASNDDDESTDDKSLTWSRGINISSTSIPSDQYLRIPSYGDVKLIMHTRCHTTYINILPISQVEISARDIRSRLQQNDEKSQNVDIVYKRSLAHTENEKPSLNIHSSPSSTSATSFFSAQEEISGTESTASSQLNLTLRPRVQTTTSHVNDDQLKPIAESEESNFLEGSVTVFLHGITVVITQDVNENAQKIEVASLNITDLFVNVESISNLRSLSVYIGDLQLDNQMFDQGGFDFPVVLISQNPRVRKEKSFCLSNRFNNDIYQIKENSLIAIDYLWEIDGRTSACKELRTRVSPISAYIEDTYITQLLDYATSLVPPCFVMPLDGGKKNQYHTSMTVHIPDYIMIDAKILSTPLRIQSFVIEPVSILLSVHTSVRLYVALDHSPLYFGTFERKNLLTTPYRLGNAFIMHYLSGAIFGAGWVVGSLEILGSPGGLAQALGSGLRDFVSLPFQGLLQGPWGFLVGITHGSASLMKHVTAGTVNSVTKLASSVARNLDRLTLDEEHLQRQEESRRMRPQGMAQGLYQGLSGLGMSLLAAVAGLAHHPLQQVWSGEATTRGLVTGVGLGLVGVVTKPLSGAAELVALTGQGLLQGAGWNSLPSPKQRPVVQYSTGSNNASVRYAWRLMPLLSNGNDSILHVASADRVIHQGSNQAVMLVLTRQALLLVDVVEDSVEKIFPLSELTSLDHPSESTMLCLYYPPAVTQPVRPVSPTEHHEMDQEMRARVEEFVRTSSTGLGSLPTNSDAQSDTSEIAAPQPDDTLTFYVSADLRNYLLSLINIAKRQNQTSGFIVL
ncbi:vacuolar protein sorting-associated protein 13B isoform X2 [Cephus cinctus]|nr:vacuolar protein sorting-associated protein 13B isoform X2 [Cephus cinctus]